MIRWWILLILGLALILQACGVGTSADTRTPAATRPAVQSQAAPTDPPEIRPSNPTSSTAPASTSPVPPASTASPAYTPEPTASPEPTAATSPIELAEATPRPTMVNTPGPTATRERTPAKPVARYVETEGYASANLRRRPTTGSPVVLSIPYGARVRAQLVVVTGADGAEWYEVTYRSETGYVLGSLLSERKPQPRPTPTATPRTPARTWTLTAVGDIMLSRTVLGKMEAYDSYRHPFTQTADILRAADLTVANLEGQVSDNVTPSSDPYTFSFVSPTAALDGVQWSGIDAVSLANNHTLDYGSGALADTMQALERYDIGYFGAGRDRESSYESRIFNINGQRVAFLGFTDVMNGNYPDPSLPTPAPAHPAEQVAEAVRTAHERADVVIPYFHWGVEYVATPNSRQRSLAHAAIDAGADLVIGAHPHWVQTTERYKGKLIAYSLGNFVFDQMWSRETRQGVVATFTFEGSQMVGVKYTPILIEDYNQPHIATDYDRDAVLERMGLGE